MGVDVRWATEPARGEVLREAARLQTRYEEEGTRFESATTEVTGLIKAATSDLCEEIVCVESARTDVAAQREKALEQVRQLDAGRVERDKKDAACCKTMDFHLYSLQ